MNVLWLGHAIPYPPSAGFLLRSYNLLRQLARRHTVDLVAFIQEPWLTTTFPTLEEGLRESRQVLGQFCRTVTFLPIDRLGHLWGKQLIALSALLSGSTYTGTWLISAPARSTISRILGSRSYDLFHLDTIGLASYRALANDVPATLTHHNIESHMMFRRARNCSNAPARCYFQHEARMLRKLEQQVAPRFAAHITCSELDSQRLRDIVPQARVAVIPNGVDCEFFASRNPEIRPNSLIFVGTMNWYPNVEAMLYFLREIWPALKMRAPAATMDIVGSNPPPSIIQLARSLPDVTVHGYLPDVRPLLDSAALFVCPIRDGGGTKLKLLDAFAMKKCVVAHPIACEGIDVTDGTNVILGSTTNEFVTEISALLKDDSRRRTLAQGARSLVERRYSYAEIGAQFCDMLEDLVRKPS